MVCQKVKAERQVPSGLLQPIRILEWKWDQITMDFVVGLLVTGRKHDLVWVVVDRLTKSAHFLPVRTNYSLNKLAELYIREIVWLHGIPILIISDRDTRFTSRFWGKLQEALGPRLNFNTVTPSTPALANKEGVKLYWDSLLAFSDIGRPKSYNYIKISYTKIQK